MDYAFFVLSCFLVLFCERCLSLVWEGRCFWSALCVVLGARIPPQVSNVTETVRKTKSVSKSSFAWQSAQPKRRVVASSALIQRPTKPIVGHVPNPVRRARSAQRAPVKPRLHAQATRLYASMFAPIQRPTKNIVARVEQVAKQASLASMVLASPK